MKKILLSFVFILFLAADSHGLPSLQVEINRSTQPLQTNKSSVYFENIYREYHNDGTLKSEISYKDGQLDGRCRFYYRNGNLRRQIDYENGLIEGKAFELYENGQYRIESNYIHGVTEDVTKMFYDNGNLYSFMVYKNGQLIKSFTLDVDGRTITKVVD